MYVDSHQKKTVVLNVKNAGLGAQNMELKKK